MLVAIVKLVDLAELTIGLGLFCFISLLLVGMAGGSDVTTSDLECVVGEDEHAGD